MVAVVVIVLMCIAPEAQASARSSWGVVTGKVTGPSNVAVPGARIILFDMETRARIETWSDAAGNYVFKDVPPGNYRAIVMLVGFRPALLGPVEVTAGKTATANATLAIATPGEGMMFGNFRPGTARPGAARAGEAGHGGPPAQGPAFGQFAQRGRVSAVGQFPSSGGMSQGSEAELSSILSEAGGEGGATSGVRFSEGAGGEAGAEGGSGITGDMAGAAGASSSFLLAGNTVDAAAPPIQRGRRMMFRFGGRPMGGPAGVPFGGGPGVIMFFGGPRRARVNQLRGNFFDSYTNSAFDARPYPLNTPSQAQPSFYREMVGISLGGPLVIPKVYNGANKTSFFFHFDLQRGTSPDNLLASVPTAAERQGNFSATTIAAGPNAGQVPVIYQPSATPGPRTPFQNNTIPASMLNSAAVGLLNYIPLPNLPGEVQNYHVQLSLPSSRQVFMGRVDHQISAKDNLAFMYFYNSSHTDGVTGYPNITSTTTTRMQNASLTETHNFGTRTVNTLSVNFNRMRNFLTNPFAFRQNIPGELGITGVSQNPMDWGLPNIGFTNFSGLADSTPSLTRNQTLRLSDSIFHSAGNHNLSIGGNVAKIQVNTLTDPDGEGSFSFTGYSTSNFTAQGTPVGGTGYDLADFLLGLPQTTSERYGIPANYLRSARYDFYASDDWRASNHLTLDLGGRWEYAAPFTEKYGHLSDLAVGPGFTTAGVVTGLNPGNLPASLLRGQLDNVAPRIGLAYRPWISHSLVVRAGYGIFYDESIYQSVVNDLVNQAPFATTSTQVTTPKQPLTIEHGFPAINSTTAHNTFAVDPHFHTPYAQTWNFMLEQDLSQTYILSVAYIGTRGTYLNLLLAPNIAVNGSGVTRTANALPFEYDTGGASSLYNGLRVSLRHFSRHNFSFFLNYTYSKAEDNASSVGGAASARGFFILGGPGGLGGGSAISAAVSPLPPAQNPFDLRAEWALSGFNPTHSVRAFGRYQLPFGDHEPFLNHGGKLAGALSNWSISDMTSFSSGLPYTAYIAGNASNNVNGLAPFGGLRADATGLPVELASSRRTSLNYFNPAAFAVPPAGQFGNAGRNTIPGPPSINFNMALNRFITLSRERNWRMNIQLATTNTFNIVNYTSLATTVNSNTFGRVTGVGSMRTMTISMRLMF